MNKNCFIGKSDAMHLEQINNRHHASLPQHQKNSLLRWRNHTRDKEEKIFIMNESGQKQI